MTPRPVAVYVAADPVDLRGSFDRLAATTRNVLGLDPGTGALFLFFNRRRDLLKALWWDRNGFALLAKRLSKSTFARLDRRDAQGPYLEVSAADFARLVAGLPLSSVPTLIH